MIFDGVVGSTGEEFSDESPFISKSEYRVALLFVSLNDDMIFFIVPSFLADVGVQVIMPSLSALLADSARELLGDVAPVFRTVLFY